MDEIREREQAFLARSGKLIAPLPKPRVIAATGWYSLRAEIIPRLFTVHREQNLKTLCNPRHFRKSKRRKLLHSCKPSQAAFV